MSTYRNGENSETINSNHSAPTVQHLSETIYFSSPTTYTTTDVTLNASKYFTNLRAPVQARRPLRSTWNEMTQDVTDEEKGTWFRINVAASRPSIIRDLCERRMCRNAPQHAHCEPHLRGWPKNGFFSIACVWEDGCLSSLQNYTYMLAFVLTSPQLRM